MKSKVTLAVLAIALLSSAPSLHATCTNATMLGNWGFTAAGTIILPTGPVPVGAVGSVKFKLDGNVSGDQDRSLGGGVAHETFSGSYALTGDCALTVVVNVYDDAGNLQRTTTLKGVVVKNGRESRMIYQSLVLPDGSALPSVLTLDANRT
jgi:hypothetical protein